MIYDIKYVICFWVCEAGNVIQVVYMCVLEYSENLSAVLVNRIAAYYTLYDQYYTYTTQECMNIFLFLIQLLHIYIYTIHSVTHTVNDAGQWLNKKISSKIIIKLKNYSKIARVFMNIFKRNKQTRGQTDDRGRTALSQSDTLYARGILKIHFSLETTKLTQSVGTQNKCKYFFLLEKSRRGNFFSI